MISEVKKYSTEPNQTIVPIVKNGFWEKFLDISKRPFRVIMIEPISHQRQLTTANTNRKSNKPPCIESIKIMTNYKLTLNSAAEFLIGHV